MGIGLSGLGLMTASPNDDYFYLFYHGATKPEKSGMHNTALVCKYYYGTGKSLGPRDNTGWQTPDFLSW